jgi:hypothetical protein
MSICMNCSSKVAVGYGGYCKQHRKYYLLNDNMIILNRFTCNHKDYTLPELKQYHKQMIKSKHSYKKGGITYKKPVSSYKKIDYFIDIMDYYNYHRYTSEMISKIIRCQSIVRKQLVLMNIRLRGSGYLNRNICNNDEDFYTYDLTHEIDDIYFFSYKDTNHKYWCFDIRSLKKLIDMNYGNPYTIESIPDEIKCKVNTLISKLQERDIQVVFENTMISDRKLAVKQKFVDIFSQIEISGYSCNIEWVLQLSIPRLKRLYKELEDIWNYRANLPIDVKRNISPPDGCLFVIPVHDYINCHVKVELLEILATELLKILNATTTSDMNLGFMYFIVGLSEVNKDCLLVHPWVHYTM